ncbi:hypothetical protein B0H10DRAFT_130605 [Mycena sp. CBHHK59/15]|nr:hypothetical protein B0H10DRAFT_130605 [Mycena sp. CBHHK59/15]
MASQGSRTPTPTPTPTPSLNGLAASPPFIFPAVSPPLLEPGPKRTTSANTRPPKHYDMHLHPGLILKCVQYLPSNTSMPIRFCGIVDDALEHRDESTANLDFPTTLNLAGWDDARFMTHEKSVAKYYQATTASWAPSLAHTLAFQDPNEVSAVHFTQTSADAPGNGAISDGFLTLDIMNVREAKIGLSPEAKTDLELLEDERFCNSVVANWEFKSLAAGTKDVMDAVGVIAHNKCPFPWIRCRSLDNCSNKTQHLDRYGAVRVTGDRMGLDAAGSNLLSLPDEAEGIPSNGSGTLFFSSEESTVDESQGSEFDSSILSLPEMKARHMLQQIWAQAVKHDTTFLVLHCGNYEYIGIRHRATQTLYLSELIIPRTAIKSAVISRFMWGSTLRPSRMPLSAGS